MRSGSSRVRIKVVALLLSMTALWAFAAWVTLREGLSLLYVTTTTNNVGKPAETLINALQDERRLSTVYLGGGRTAAARAALAGARTRSDAARAGFERLSASTALRFAAGDELRGRIADERAALRGLGRLRGWIDTASTGRSGAADAYTQIISAGFHMYNALSGLDDQRIAKESRALIGLTRARELLSEEDALLAGALAAGRFVGDEPQQFIQLAGQRRYVYQEAAADLPAGTAGRYQAVMAGDDLTRLRALEDRVIDQGGGSGLPFRAAVWDEAVRPAQAELRDLELRGADATVADATPVAAGVIIRLVLAGGLGLIAVVASIILSITTARALVRQLERLRNAANELSGDRLPRVVERLRRGEEVDVALEAPPLRFGSDEIGQVGRAFNAVQETAVRVAVEQAELRRGIRDVFLSLARRSQALLHRQLGLLDAMERRSTEAEELADLFRVDHLATRMRRNAENLIVLSGAVAGRGWRNPVPMVDVVRGALAEVEDYTRVTVLPIEQAALAGRAVGDVIHLLAELIENAVSFSPPYTAVQVGGAPVANGFAVEIEDRGLGMAEADLAAANQQLAHPPEFNLTSTARLGLYVIGRLAERHGIKVRLRESPYGGTTAIVLIPTALVIDGHHAAPHRTGTAPMALDLAPAPAPEAGRAEAGQDAPAAAGPPVGRHAELPPEPPAGPLHLVQPAPPLPVRQRTGDGTAAAPQAARPAPAETGYAGARPLDDTAPALPVRDRTTDPGPAAAKPGADAMEYTPAGLPWRVRQASLALPLRATTPARPDVPGGAQPEPGCGGGEHPPRLPGVEPDEAPARGPEEVRRMMASYQTGTLRGRSEAARQVGAEPGAGADADADPEPPGERG
jgi:signal transduction histidine kinase